jgi:serine/threonine protein kinase
MYSLKVKLIKVKFLIINLVWLLLNLKSFKQYLIKNSVKDIELFKLSSWSPKVHFFIGNKERKNVFFKLVLIGSCEREHSLFKLLDKTGVSKYIPKIVKMDASQRFSVIAMELVDGLSIAELGLKLSYADAENLLKNLLELLETSEVLGFVHCDIRPENIMLSKNSEFFLIDLEYAVIKDSEFNNLKFANPNLLDGLGAEYRKPDKSFDDAYSVLLIAEQILRSNCYSETENLKLVEYIECIKSKVGSNIYTYK